MVVRPYFTKEGKVLPFDKVLELEQIDESTFRSITRSYSATGRETGSYGGHIFAQAAWAAAQTVKEGFLIHNITGWFNLVGNPNEHFTYHVEKIRDGYSYCSRNVTVTQAAAKGSTFTCVCSFKREETASVDAQAHINLKETYHEVLQDRENEPMQHSVSPSNDCAEFVEDYLPVHPEHFNPAPGLHFRKVEMAAYNRTRAPLDRKQLNFYSLRGSLPLPTAPFPPPTDPKKMNLTREANLHACTHLYASDCQSPQIVPRHLDKPRDFTHMASLSHSVIFHTGIRDLMMAPEPRVDHPDADPTLWEDGALPVCNLEGYGKGDRDGRKWFVQESWVTRAAEGRALYVSRMWDYERGVHVATSFQDGLIRFREDAKL
ncbi:hypothetical protein COCMIDRAFT_41565 [Bipolaris oryzae ATCC 44560]|uniref:Acyl-CoA thioesterase-like N-terminal HotDog domain-containing protein n=1 Tax=Bipolaris oryzae ATCC 44560 TaxID=930090 RepID=W6YLF1_COCMI|nr:uncharacterized protein COCMIDRAFT_41565 [Bipolaris oryzae ATCC 44560]EUC40037.1 hypothetical protein COCMIDRAFT_41565 [Bipolaris oryzae ATCC 44560]